MNISNATAGLSSDGFEVQAPSVHLAEKIVDFWINHISRDMMILS